VRFWETSAIMPLLLEQPDSPEVDALLEADDQMVVCWTTVVECWSAFARLRREGVISGEDEEEANQSLEQLRSHWFEIAPSESMRTQARRLVRTHRLRSADALQLAAAVIWSAQLDAHEFVSFDAVLRDAAQLEGLSLL
jgi:predicted nucleic acid-binding protein